jgi:predicted Zn finger-like uncharacterized protein
MAAHVTQCPHCRTTFRVRDEHLKVANGAVRCGSCLQVFQAAEHFVDEEQLQADKKAPEKSASQAVTSIEPKPSAIEENQLIDDDLLIHDDMDDDIDDDVRISDDGLIHDDMDDNEPDTHDSISDDPMVDLGIRAPEKEDRPAPRNDLEIDSSIFDLKNASTDSLDLLSPDSTAHEFISDKDPDEAWADALLDDDDGIEEITVGGLEISETSQYDFDDQSNNEEEYSQFKAGAEVDDFDGFIDDDDNMHLGSDDPNNEATEIMVVADSVAGLQEDPLELQKRSSGPAFPWGWGLASLIMLLIAGGQTLFFKFDQWSRTPQWRPLYTQICNLADCTLPNVQNMKQLSTQHLVVRSHPKLQKALMVDTLMQNLANYPQPFPDLELVFSDLNNNVVASRQFLPSEYLSGELAGQTLIPSRTPIHIALEIVDPGPEAVSYAIRLQSNQ